MTTSALGALSVPADSIPRHVVLVLSGGLDSTVLAYRLRADGAQLTALSFDYGQRHRRELEYASRTAHRLGAEHHVIDLASITGLLTGSALTDRDVTVPDGHYTDLSMRATVVPNRNALMLDIAVAVAVARGAGAVAFGAHSGDHPIYPDCRPAFVSAYRRMAQLANAGFAVDGFTVLAPFIGLAKSDIVTIGEQVNVPFGDSWSCYKGGDVHCGTCGTCVERREAFALARVADPTAYLTREVG
ncbi:7-cyano-7-deazaguanine synthase QueC [Catellatospora citrea]|uniref:7-cyano-7-deazaguanine synthase n=1 Tax=Catellatospora citrea TaxID=53366 RepID=A0A8J3P375_9ACTN|nr:7-cyano-7-deazaguanine synthase QueC [Catellatospora citrea]RKE07901.1 7-cyano-7-deazaguanine synthase [Catellatospora citrea]GIG02089.1 7-cyano-7-deazaguanine synthase [Catellatospora citrea]